MHKAAKEGEKGGVKNHKIRWNVSQTEQGMEVTSLGFDGERETNPKFYKEVSTIIRNKSSSCQKDNGNGEWHGLAMS